LPDINLQAIERKNANRKALIDANIKSLEEGETLLAGLNDDLYRKGVRPIFESTLGAHFRHFIEHYQCFFLQLPQRRFCYDDRQRNQALEEDLNIALNDISAVKSKFREFDFGSFEHTYTICDDQTEEDVATSLERELIFLQSHTVHHYAIIAAIVRALGKTTLTGFGVAIATKNFDIRSDQNSEDSSCAQ
jgi:hypothetical protein